MNDKTLTVLMIGDVSGLPGMGALYVGLSRFVKDNRVDFVVCNGENAAAGFGIMPDDYYKMKECGCDVITSGNHIWQQSDILPLLDSQDSLLRPANYPQGVAGHGYCTIVKNGITFAVVNLQGRQAMPVIDCPFKIGLSIVEKLHKLTPYVFVDFHAESVEEKEALAYYLDGKVSAIVGTHTHVQTADARILPQGSGYITDLGMTGVQEAVIGSKPELSIQRQLTQLPIRSEVSDGSGAIQGALLTIAKDTGHCLEIKPFTR